VELVLSVLIICAILYLLIKDVVSNKLNRPAKVAQPKLNNPKATHNLGSKNLSVVSSKNAQSKNEVYVKSLHSSNVYKLNLLELTCNCQDWTKRRYPFAPNGIHSACKHLLNYFYHNQEKTSVKALKYLALLYGSDSDYKPVPFQSLELSGSIQQKDSSESNQVYMVSPRLITVDEHGVIDNDQWIMGGMHDICILYNPSHGNYKNISVPENCDSEHLSMLREALLSAQSKIIEADSKMRFHVASALVIDLKNKKTINVIGENSYGGTINITFNCNVRDIVNFEIKSDKGDIFHYGKYNINRNYESRMEGPPVLWRGAQPFMHSIINNYKIWRNTQDSPPVTGQDVMVGVVSAVDLQY
jgi:hypothetical protein